MQAMTAGIYALYTQQEECLYVGQSKDCEARYRQHLTKLRRRRSSALAPFVDWFHASGGQDALIVFRLLEEVPEPLARNRAELLWFQKLSPRFYGKRPSLSKTWGHTQETKEKIASALRKETSLPARPCSTCAKPTRSSGGVCRACLLKEKKKLFEERYGKEIMAYYEQDYSLRAIAEKLRLPPVTLQRYMKDLGIKVENRRFAGQRPTDGQIKIFREAVNSHNNSKQTTKTCRKCSSTFTTKPSDGRKFCTRLCYREFQIAGDIAGEV